MNTTRTNPNIRRFGLPLAVTAAFLGGACTAEAEPTPVQVPPPAEITISPAGKPNPSCAVKAEVSGQTVSLSLAATDEELPGVYVIETIQYEYGDGDSAIDNSHTYAKAGSYTVRASMTMDVAPGTEIDAPFPDGFAVPCSPATVTIKD